MQPRPTSEIWAYLAIEASEASADRMLSTIEDSFRLLQSFPFSGPVREMLVSRLRVTFQGIYAVYYIPRTKEVVIVRVLHAARDITTIADIGGLTE